jgi:hypothetical protein
LGLFIFSFSCPTQCELKLTRLRDFLTCGVKSNDEGGKMKDEPTSNQAYLLPIVDMRLPRLKKSCGRSFILHPSAFIP